MQNSCFGGQLRTRTKTLAHFAIGLLLSTSMGHSWAAYLSPEGSGQVLLFPFVTSGNGWDTYLGLNLYPIGRQVVKLRFLDPETGEVANTFNIYGSEGENWRAAVTETSEGTRLVIGEGSCTISSNGEFGGPGAQFELNHPTSLAEAYLVSGDLHEDLDGATCEELADRWDDEGAWTLDPNDRLVQPPFFQDVFSGYFDLIRVDQGLSAALPAQAINDFSEFIPHTAPDSELPNLASADPVAALPTGVKVVPESGLGIDAIALILTTRDLSRIGNDVITVDGIAASTDWIITFPLRPYGHQGGYPVEIDGGNKLCDPNGSISETDPSVPTFVGTYWTVSGSGKSNYGSGAAPLDPPPRLEYEPFLCNVLNIVSFGENEPIFLSEQSPLQYQIKEIYEESIDDTSYWIEFIFPDGRAPSFSPGEIGRPVVAFRATTYVNGTLEGGSVLANYMATRYHSVR